MSAHVQEEMVFRKLDKNGQLRGGKRKNAGRKPPAGQRRCEPHVKRAVLRPNHPVHVTLRVERVVGNLRAMDTYRAIRKATAVMLRRWDFRIVHVSIQRDHVHLLVEARDQFALSSGMRAFEISAARHLNFAVTQRLGLEKRRKGRVFADRYHPEIITCPRQARNVLAYVLNNWRKHGEDRSAESRNWKIDPFSSAVSFCNWAELEGKWHPAYMAPPGYEHLETRYAETWLLHEGWLQGGGPVSITEVPGTRPN